MCVVVLFSLFQMKKQNDKNAAKMQFRDAFLFGGARLLFQYYTQFSYQSCGEPKTIVCGRHQASFGCIPVQVGGQTQWQIRIRYDDAKTAISGAEVQM